MFIFISTGATIRVISKTPKGFIQTEIPTQSTSKILQMSMSYDNSTLAVLREGCKPEVLSVEDINAVKIKHIINVKDVTALRFRRTTNCLIALGTQTGEILIYDIASSFVVGTFQKVTTRINCLNFTYDDVQLCVITGKLLFVFYDIEKNEGVDKYPQKVECTWLEMHPYRHHLVALGYQDGSITLLNLNTRRKMYHFQLAHSPICSMSLSHSGRYVATSSNRLLLCRIDDATRKIIQHKFPFYKKRPVASVVWSPNGAFLLVGLQNGTLAIHDTLQNFEVIFNVRFQDDPVMNIIATTVIN